MDKTSQEFCMLVPYDMATHVNGTGRLKASQELARAKGNAVNFPQGQGCTYIVEVQTGDRNWAGTSATVDLRLCYNQTACFVYIPDLTDFGLAGPSHKYFQRGNLDFFRILTKKNCHDVCKITIGHDNAGTSPDWYLDYVKVEAYDGSVPKFENLFVVYQWIAKGQLHLNVTHCPTIKAAAAQLAYVLPSSAI
ncbi:hypothetical protein Cgig2_000209 [Carnegiea gigantea]|uniref:PLAT domain-containing protein n=1 Tax=Carnegiea gigantea TaxID=171969 RepID=A0A9Q1KMB6_9CARY|nr:hypothetical protein Cgig2_000209 [Carnegiea gigantea]